jgi:hypothetical protein
MSDKQKVIDTSLEYYLISFDKNSNECRPQEGRLISEEVLAVLAKEPITDVFLMSHGWLGDVPAAKNQYQRWITAMAKNQADIQKMQQVRPGFNPLLIGLHWPSKPWGNENLDATASFDTTEDSQVNDLIEEYAHQVSDTEATREALRTVFSAGIDYDTPPENLSPELLQAYQVLIQEASLSSEDEDTKEWNENEPLDLDPESVYQASLTEETADVSFGIGESMEAAWDKFLIVPRLLSYWKMKNLARQIGQTSGFELLKKLQQTANDDVRFHLMGHSFGTIVVSATIAGIRSNNKLVRPVNSLALIQGAVSLWSYSAKVPDRNNLAGYFYPIITEGRVAGPIITTQSRYDTAVGKAYLIAGKIGLQMRQDIDFAPTSVSYPSIGGIGTYGIQGEGLDITNQDMLTVEKSYNFQPGKIYNLNSDEFIKDGNKDAHSAIDKPEVAHAVWSAALVS